MAEMAEMKTFWIVGVYFKTGTNRICSWIGYVVLTKLLSEGHCQGFQPEELEEWCCHCDKENRLRWERSMS